MMTTIDADKEAFYDNLHSVLHTVPFRDQLFLHGDFNAQVTHDEVMGPKVLSWSTLSQQVCSKHQLAITNTFYQQANKYQNTWQPPCSKHQHVLDYAITWITSSHHLKNLHITRAVHSTGQCTSLVGLTMHPPQWHHTVRWPKLNAEETCLKLIESVHEKLHHPQMPGCRRQCWRQVGRNHKGHAHSCVRNSLLHCVKAQ